MIRIEALSHAAVYLNHNQLINESFNENVNTSSTYSLKSHLFHFKPKPPTTSSKSRKRKAKNCSDSVESLELKNVSNALLASLKQTKIVLNSTPCSYKLDRVWEEPTAFPQLRGANATNKFQHYTLNSNEYIIPPRCTFFNHDLEKLKELENSLEKYDFVVMDPPWRNKYIRRIKKAKQELGYRMMDNELLSDIPLDEFIHTDSIVAIWCTNSKQHQRDLLEEILPRWDLCLLHRIVWLKLNTDGDLIGEIGDDGKKQPYEILFIARHKDSKANFIELKKLEFLLSVPSVIHSHKPPILQLFRSVLGDNPKCLELFARYLQPGFTSIGLEVLKLMDKRLYTQEDDCS